MKTNGHTVGGVRIATSADPSVLMANTIIYGNSGWAIDMTATSDYAPFLNCYVQSTDALTKTTIAFTKAFKILSRNIKGFSGI